MYNLVLLFIYLGCAGINVPAMLASTNNWSNFMAFGFCMGFAVCHSFRNLIEKNL